jgi:hypothetical protein
MHTIVIILVIYCILSYPLSILLIRLLNNNLFRVSTTESFVWFILSPITFIFLLMLGMQYIKLPKIPPFNFEYEFLRKLFDAK